MAPRKKAPTFEDDLARLEEIAEAMESGDAPLEELCARYDEGMKLAASLQKRLEASACRLKIVKEGENDAPVTEDSPLAEAEAPSEDDIEEMDENAFF